MGAAVFIVRRSPLLVKINNFAPSRLRNTNSSRVAGKRVHLLPSSLSDVSSCVSLEVIATRGARGDMTPLTGKQMYRDEAQKRDHCSVAVPVVHLERVPAHYRFKSPVSLQMKAILDSLQS